MLHPGGGQSHDLLLGLPTCCLLRRPLPGPAPGSGYLGAQPMQGEGGGPMCHLPAHLEPEALSSHLQGDLASSTPWWLWDPRAHLATSLSLCFLISETV